jgi:hypothetical protein
MDMIYFDNDQLCVQVGSQTLLKQSLLTFAGQNDQQAALEPAPSSAQILQALEDAYAQGYEQAASTEFELKGVALAGSGDPLLHLDVVAEVVTAFKQKRHGVPITLVTSGLVSAADAEEDCQRLLELGVERLQVFVPAANPPDYAKVTGVTPTAFNDLCHFIQGASEIGLDVRTFTFAPCPQRSELRALSQSLGARAFAVKDSE